MNKLATESITTEKLFQLLEAISQYPELTSNEKFALLIEKIPTKPENKLKLRRKIFKYESTWFRIKKRLKQKGYLVEQTAK